MLANIATLRRIVLGPLPPTIGQERVVTLDYGTYQICHSLPADQIIDQAVCNPALTDAEVDAFLAAHENDPVDEAQLARVRKRFNEKVGQV